MKSAESNPGTGAGELAKARSAVYRFLLAALECPDEHNHAWLTGPEFRQGLTLLGDHFNVLVPEGELFSPRSEDAQSLYLSCFEIGLKGPPVPLLASHYNHREPVPATIHEHVLFYRRFGASVPPGCPTPPDHLCQELAFLVHLDDLWGSGRIDTLSATQARADFLSRQLARWVGHALNAAMEAGLPPVYLSLLGILRRAVDDDLAGCRQALQEPEQVAP